MLSLSWIVPGRQVIVVHDALDACQFDAVIVTDMSGIPQFLTLHTPSFGGRSLFPKLFLIPAGTERAHCGSNPTPQ